MSDELLRRLLGPEGPEIGCDECFDKLDAWVEGTPVPGMEAHLEGCSACAEEAESLAALLRAEER